MCFGVVNENIKTLLAQKCSVQRLIFYVLVKETYEVLLEEPTQSGEI